MKFSYVAKLFRIGSQLLMAGLSWVLLFVVIVLLVVVK